MLHELEPLTLEAFEDLVLWSMIVLLTIMVDSTSTNSSADKEKHEHADFVKMNLFCLEDDSVACIFWSLHPLSLQNVFLAMAHNFPRTLEALILHLRSPVGAEVLT